MGLTPITSRDRMLSAVDLGRKVWRYGWLVAVFAVVGAAASLAFALTRPDRFQSWATLFYQGGIQSQLLLPGREDAAARNLGDRFRELLLARPQLEPIIADPSLDPFPDEPRRGRKIDQLRRQIRFVSRGANAFRIEYTDSDPERARRVVDKLTELLQDKDEALRNQQAIATRDFAIEQQRIETAVLQKREQALDEFVTMHPEFAAQTERPAVAAPAKRGNPRLATLEDQAARIKRLLDAPPDAPRAAVHLPPSPEPLAAEAQVERARRDVQSAETVLRDVRSRLTDIHPTVVHARAQLDNANDALRLAEAAVPPTVEPVIQPATPAERARLENELRQLQAQIAHERSTGKASDAADLTVRRVIELESENATLRRAVTEHRDRTRLLSDAVFRATMDVNQKRAEGNRLTVIDPAFTPDLPLGPGKTVLLLAGLVVFLTLGLSLAIVLAVIDDRLYRRVDLEQSGLPTLAVVPPPAQRSQPSTPQAPP